MNSEELKELCVERYLGVAGVFVDSVKEVGLLVVVWCEDDIVDDALKDLDLLAYYMLLPETQRTECSFCGSSSTASVSSTCL